ncbi:hypothetical protein [uncultured Thomasclavelia sp.]|uniref:hypothetical protein n=1 Tax=uncultured Thomasclavelia sp. TaxID=3025759 RepID=UPI0026390EF8|nr:hypothetical protein [uncultured Thomasclavelia sp.]
MLINNANELNNMLKKVAMEAMNQVREQVSDCIDKFIKQYYAEYKPEQYYRTYQFFDSLVVPSVKANGNTLTCEIYLDPGSMNYKNASGQAVLEMIDHGYHAMRRMGAPYDIPGTAVWSESVSYIEKYDLVIGTFKKYLESQGFTVV